MRLTACFNVPLDIIMPCGFPFSDKTLKRAAMDYGDAADIVRHANAESFFVTQKEARRRIILLTSKGKTRLPDAAFQADDVLLLGSESAGAPEDVHVRADMSIRIPMQAGFRSLNIAVAAGIALGEAMRQTESYPL